MERPSEVSNLLRRLSLFKQRGENAIPSTPWHHPRHHAHVELLWELSPFGPTAYSDPRGKPPPPPPGTMLSGGLFLPLVVLTSLQMHCGEGFWFSFFWAWIGPSHPSAMLTDKKDFHPWWGKHSLDGVLDLVIAPVNGHLLDQSFTTPCARLTIRDKAVMGHTESPPAVRNTLLSYFCFI